MPEFLIVFAIAVVAAKVPNSYSSARGAQLNR